MKKKNTRNFTESNEVSYILREFGLSHFTQNLPVITHRVQYRRQIQYSKSYANTSKNKKTRKMDEQQQRLRGAVAPAISLFPLPHQLGAPNFEGTNSKRSALDDIRQLASEPPSGDVRRDPRGSGDTESTATLLKSGNIPQNAPGGTLCGPNTPIQSYGRSNHVNATDPDSHHVHLSTQVSYA